MAYAASADMCIKAVNPILPFNYILHQRYEFFIRCTFYLSYMLTSQKCMNNLLIPIFVVLFLIIFPLISFTTVKNEHLAYSIGPRFLFVLRDQIFQPLVPIAICKAGIGLASPIWDRPSHPILYPILYLCKAVQPFFIFCLL